MGVGCVPVAGLVRAKVRQAACPQSGKAEMWLLRSQGVVEGRNLNIGRAEQ